MSGRRGVFAVIIRYTRRSSGRPYLFGEQVARSGAMGQLAAERGVTQVFGQIRNSYCQGYSSPEYSPYHSEQRRGIGEGIGRYGDRKNR